MPPPEPLETIMDGETMVAIIIRNHFRAEGITFFTPPEFSQQLAYMRRPKHHVVSPHAHNEVHREVSFTQEVLFIRRGRLRADLFDKSQKKICSRELSAGDVILLAGGGHGFTFLEESEIIEVKQGPYSGDKDKIRFECQDDSR